MYFIQRDVHGGMLAGFHHFPIPATATSARQVKHRPASTGAVALPMQSSGTQLVPANPAF